MRFFLKYFALVFVTMFTLMGYGAFHYAREVNAIASNPVFITTDDYFADRRKGKDKNYHEYMLIYDYRVSGQRYQVRTGWMAEGKMKELTANAVEVAYNPAAPGRGMLKTKYDAFKPADNMPRVLVSKFFLSLAIAFAAAAILTYARFRQ